MNKREKTLLIKIITVIILVIICFSADYILNKNNEKNKEVNLENEETKNTSSQVESSDTNLEVHYIDQTTPNMIQRISGIFERNPLIYGDI